MKIIAICGQKGTGKDLVSNIIEQSLQCNNIPCKRIQFGDLTKQIICTAFNITNDREYNCFIRGMVTTSTGKEVSGKSIAKTIQMKVRQANNKIFIDNLQDSIEQYKHWHQDIFNDTVFVITDLRMKDELKWCRRNNVYIIKVKRDSGYFDPLVDQIDIDDIFCDDVIYNDGTEQQLNDLVKTNIDKWLQKQSTYTL